MSASGLEVSDGDGVDTTHLEHAQGIEWCRDCRSERNTARIYLQEVAEREDKELTSIGGWSRYIVRPRS